MNKIISENSEHIYIEDGIATEKMDSIDRFGLTPLDVSLISNEAFCSLTLRGNICGNKSIKLTKNEINDINIILGGAIAREIKLLNNY